MNLRYDTHARRLLRMLALLSTQPRRQGRCYDCEQFTTWTMHYGFYRCTHCGNDPVARRPEPSD